jgi:hypothetical protein
MRRGDRNLEKGGLKFNNASNQKGGENGNDDFRQHRFEAAHEVRGMDSRDGLLPPSAEFQQREKKRVQRAEILYASLGFRLDGMLCGMRIESGRITAIQPKKIFLRRRETLGWNMDKIMRERSIERFRIFLRQTNTNKAIYSPEKFRHDGDRYYIRIQGPRWRIATL